MSRLIALLQQLDIRLCATYLLESQFMDDRTKYFSGVLSAMSCMINLEIPHLNIMSKMDLSKKRKRDLERYLDPDPLLLADEATGMNNPKWQSLNEALVQVVSTES
jgi:GPN-loop GTPase